MTVTVPTLVLVLPAVLFAVAAWFLFTRWLFERWIDPAMVRWAKRHWGLTNAECDEALRKARRFR